MKSTRSIGRMREEDVVIISETENIRKLTAKDAMIKAVFVYLDDDADL